MLDFPNTEDCSNQDPQCLHATSKTPKQLKLAAIFAKYDNSAQALRQKPLYFDSAADDLTSSRRFQGDVERKKEGYVKLLKLLTVKRD